MSSNADNAMTRFLFAILRQKNLKDIDWNKVAHDPILAQEITNGHAARMRYSRFRSAMLGLEPTRRNRTGPPKSRVTKAKKDAKPKTESSMKTESPAATPNPQEPSETSAPNIKQESLQQPRLEHGLKDCLEDRLENRLTPGLTPGPSMPAPSSSVVTPHNMRLLTPCSDTDVFVPGLRASPTSDMVNSQTPLDFSQPPRSTHEDPPWTPNMAYAIYSSTYEDFPVGACDHHHLHLHDQFGMQLPSTETDGDHHTEMKHEDWESCM